MTPADQALAEKLLRLCRDARFVGLSSPVESIKEWWIELEGFDMAIAATLAETVDVALRMIGEKEGAL